ncbi:flavin-dependent oxidoreductase [Leucobacter sp. cx-42]|uniref:flavin-dependent oxidoreductase n=1 Tax=unclassified Leucobacter TaxID=2621730 RepID=UPI00165E51A1|nr:MULTISPECIES: flavin-dependent oxidoreductase [unclassified Leucobacter]MBC9954463.1 flavin-dependent oxidoreductase [Leucobacter sp. cx-42]
MRIIIVGAGIAGLSTALSLEAAGFTDITIYERTAQVRGLGVGLNLLPHAVRELTELGLKDRIEALGVEPTALAYFNRFGQPIWSEPRGTAAGYIWPQLSVHRGELQLLLLDAVTERLGDIVRTGHRLIEVADGDETTATFETATGPVTATADLIIGADGIHSSLRQLRYPDEGAPPWSGLTLWRGTARIPQFLDGATMVMTGDGDQKFVAYPLEAPAADGTQRVNFIAEHRAPGSPGADWNRTVDPAPIVELFREWRYDWLDVPATIAAAEEILEYPMVDRDALPQWTFGQTTLVGDAAHAMYPNGSNGGSQAILDARTLAWELATAVRGSAPTITDDRAGRAAAIACALERYEAKRRPATATLLEMTRQTGPERVMLLARERAPEGFADINDVIPLAEREQIALSYKQAAGFDPAMLAERSSLTVEARA